MGLHRERTQPDTSGMSIVFKDESRTPKTAYDAIGHLDTDSFGYLHYTGRRLTDEELEALKSFINLGGTYVVVTDGPTTGDDRIKTTQHQEYAENGTWWWEIDEIWWED